MSRSADGPRSPTTAAEYVRRVNRAIDHARQNLDRPVSLEELARVACFSPFHFHRVFRSLIGEPLHKFTRRLRLERAIALLSHRRGRSLTQIALDCGFASSSDFSRTFRQHYGVAPSRFDVAAFRDQGRHEWLQGMAAPDGPGLPPRLAANANPDGFTATLRRLPARRVAYLRVLDPFRPDAVASAARRLVAWAEARQQADGQWLGWMWDDPEIVARERCRYDVGVEIPDVAADGEVGALDLPPMLVAEVAVRGGIELELRAIDWLYVSWLPTSGYVPADQPLFEAWLGRPFATGTAHFELQLQLPVVPV